MIPPSSAFKLNFFALKDRVKSASSPWHHRPTSLQTTLHLSDHRRSPPHNQLLTRPPLAVAPEPAQLQRFPSAQELRLRPGQPRAHNPRADQGPQAQKEGDQQRRGDHRRLPDCQEQTLDVVGRGERRGGLRLRTRLRGFLRLRNGRGRFVIRQLA